MRQPAHNLRALSVVAGMLCILTCCIAFHVLRMTRRRATSGCLLGLISGSKYQYYPPKAGGRDVGCIRMIIIPQKLKLGVLTFLEELVAGVRTLRFRGEAAEQPAEQPRFRKVPLRFPFRFSFRFPEGSARVPRGSAKVLQGSLRFLKDFPCWEGSARFREGSAKVPQGSTEGSAKFPRRFRIFFRFFREGSARAPCYYFFFRARAQQGSARFRKFSQSSARMFYKNF